MGNSENLVFRINQTGSRIANLVENVLASNNSAKPKGRRFINHYSKKKTIKPQVYCSALYYGFLNVRPLNEVPSSNLVTVTPALE